MILQAGLGLYAWRVPSRSRRQMNPRGLGNPCATSSAVEALEKNNLHQRHEVDPWPLKNDNSTNNKFFFDIN